MKKSILGIVLFGAFSGTTLAASSISLYGRLDVGYGNKVGSTVIQEDPRGIGQSRFGVKGQEDLGNGLSAIFQLEAGILADTGNMPAGFNRESTVGLKGKFGQIRFGRSVASIFKNLIGFAPGEQRNGAIWDPYVSMTRHSNAMFYDYSDGGFAAGFSVTTKGGAAGNLLEGVTGQKVGYGFHAAYVGSNYKLAGAYQADNTTAYTHEWGIGASYTLKPVTLSATYANAKSPNAAKTQTWGVAFVVPITLQDKLYLKYQNRAVKALGIKSYQGDMWGVGYSHALSKRTMVYADVGLYRLTRNAQGTVDKFGTGIVGTGRATLWDVALRHTF